MRDGEYVPPGANPFGGAIGGLAAALEPVNDASAPLTGGGGGSAVPVGAGGPEGSPMHLPATQSKVMLFHVLFKAIALVIYLLSGMIFNTNEGGGYVMTFVIVTILSALDFWTVKNVSGRLMVGLRWWSEVNEDGSTTWKFEAQEVRHVGQPSPCGGPHTSQRAARARAGQPAEHLAGHRRLLGRSHRAGGRVGIARRGHVPEAQIRLAAARVHCDGPLRRQHHRVRAMQVGRQVENLRHGGQSPRRRLCGQGPSERCGLGLWVLTGWGRVAYTGSYLMSREGVVMAR